MLAKEWETVERFKGKLASALEQREEKRVYFHKIASTVLHRLYQGL